MNLKEFFLVVRLFIFARQGFVFYYNDGNMTQTTCGSLIEGATNQMDEILAHEYNRSLIHRLSSGSKSQYILDNKIDFVNVNRMNREHRQDMQLINQRDILLFVHSGHTNYSYIPRELVDMATHQSSFLIYKFYCPPIGRQAPRCDHLLDQRSRAAVNYPGIEVMDVCIPEPIVSPGGGGHSQAGEGALIQQVGLIRIDPLEQVTLVNMTQTGWQLNLPLTGNVLDELNQRLFAIKNHYRLALEMDPYKRYWAHVTVAVLRLTIFATDTLIYLTLLLALYCVYLALIRMGKQMLRILHHARQ